MQYRLLVDVLEAVRDRKSALFGKLVGDHLIGSAVAVACTIQCVHNGRRELERRCSRDEDGLSLIAGSLLVTAVDVKADGSMCVDHVITAVIYVTDGLADTRFIGKSADESHLQCFQRIRIYGVNTLSL